MRLKTKLLSILFCCFTLTGFTQDYFEGQLYLKLTDDVNYALRYPEQSNNNPEGLNAVFEKYAVNTCRKAFKLADPKLDRTYHITFTKAEEAEAFIKALEQLSYIEYAERVPVYKFFLTPNDLDAAQYNLDIIKATQAWDISTGSANVTIAVVDDGFLLSHNDLAPVIWTNPGEIPSNNIDDDGNGYVDDVNGWDAAENDNDPGVAAGTFAFGHGTHCAGIAAAATNNSQGIASISYNVSLIPVRNTDTSSYISHALEGVEYAVAINADVISMSFGGGRFSITFQNLVDVGHAKGIVFVAAAGNNGNTTLMYPASYNHVISVAASDNSDLPASFTTYNAAVDVTAPGAGIFSTVVDGVAQYNYKSGTSMACPLVAGLAALVKSINPALTPDQIEACIKNGADPLASTSAKYTGKLGTGRINAFETAKCATSLYVNFSANNLSICPGDSVQFTDLSIPNPTSWQWTFTGGSPSSSTLQNPKVYFPNPGSYDVKLVVSNALGTDSLERAGYIQAALPTAKISGNFTTQPWYSANIKIELTGKLPVSVRINTGDSTFFIKDINYSPFYFSVSPDSTTTYKIDSVYNSSCTGTSSDSSVITVLQPSPGCWGIGYSTKISDTEGNFTGTLDNNDYFGRELTTIGDLDKDGIPDLAVGVIYDDDGGADRGAVWILFMNKDGTVKSHQKISSTTGGFTGTLDNGDHFGSSLRNLGDLDNDGVLDIAVAADYDDDGGQDRGAVWILFLKTDGTVKSHTKIAHNTSGFGPLTNQDRFGHGIGNIGDLDNDGVVDIVAGSIWDDDAASNGGAAYVLFLKTDGTVKSYTKITTNVNGFTGTISAAGLFGYCTAGIGDLDKDGIEDIAIGERDADDGGTDRGKVWILFMKADGTVRAHTVINSSTTGFSGALKNADHFGCSLSPLNDINGDGVVDIMVGAFFDDDAGTDAGAAYLFYMKTDGSISNYEKLSSNQGRFKGTLDAGDDFGWGVTIAGDLDSNGFMDLAIVASGDDDGGTNRGAVWILMGDDTCSNAFVNCRNVDTHQKISDTQGNFTGTLNNNDAFGARIANIGDLDGDGVTDMVVGAPLDNDGGTDRGAVYILFLKTDGSVKSHQKISDTQGNFTATLDDNDRFGISVAGIGDLDKDGVVDIVVGADFDDDGGSGRGCVYILFLKTDGTVKSYQKISDTQGNFTGTLDNDDNFGASLGYLGDIDKDGIVDIAVGAIFDDDGSTNAGAFWVLFLNSNGTVKAYQKISATQGGLNKTINSTSFFGYDIETIGDLDKDGVIDIAVGSRNDDDGGTDRGAIWILFLNSNGTVKASQKISELYGNFSGLLDDGDEFGRDIANLGDINNDGVVDIAVSADRDDDGGTNIGAVWILNLYPNGMVKDYSKISATQSNFTGVLDNDDLFGTGLASMGDINRDGFLDLAIAAQSDDDGGTNRGAVYILMMKDSCTEFPCSVKADFEFSGICLDQDIEFKDLSSDTLFRSNIISRKWDFGDSTIQFGDTTPTHAYNTPDTFNVTLTIGSDYIPACFDTITKQVVIRDFFVTSLTDSATVCIGDSAYISGFSINCGFGLTTYSWAPTTGINDPNSLSIKAAPTATTTYTLTAIDGDNDTAHFDFVVVVDSSCCRSKAKIKVPERICLRDTIVFENVSNSASNATANWYFDAGTSISTYNGNTPANVYFTTSGYHTVKLVISDTCSTDSVEATVYVNELPAANAGRDTVVCLNDTLLIGDSMELSDRIYLWSPTSGLDSINRYHTRTFANITQQYILSVTDRNTGCIGKDTIEVKRSIVPDILLPNDTAICDKDTLAVNAGLGHNGYTFLWNDNSTDSLRNITTADTFWIEVTDTIGCKNRDTIITIINPLPIFSLGNDTAICPNENVLLAADSGSGLTFLWSDNSTDSSLTADTKGTYWLEITDQNSCKYRDSLELDVYLPFNLDLGNDTAICPNTSITLDAGVGGGAGWIYNWSNSSASKTTNVSTNETLYITVTSPNGCVERDTITVSVRNKPTVELQNDTAICTDEDITIGKDRGPGWSYLWNDNSTTATILADAGAYWLQVTDTAGCINRDTIIISAIPYPDVSGVYAEWMICEGDSVKLSGPFNPNYTYRWTQESTGQLLTTDSVYLTGQAGTYRLTVNNNGCLASDTVIVSKITSPTVNLGLDTTICDDRQLVLRTGFGQSKHTWQDGSSVSDYTVTKGGTYFVTIENVCDTASDTITIITRNCNCILFTPNAFTPNGEGPLVNEVWKPTLCDVTFYNLKIFTRWGELVFETENINEGWNGKYGDYDVPAGVFVYIIQYKKEGYSKQQMQGTITLLR